jgi:hypothetical protein
MKRSIMLILWLILGLEIGTLIGNWHNGPRPRPKPKYEGIAPDIVPIVRKYKDDAAKLNIHFTNPVTVGFTEISGDTIGICWFSRDEKGKEFREIDIDRRYWLASSEGSREALLFHELTHCYCTRTHDWSGGGYPEAFMIDILKFMHMYTKKGFFKDNCPVSLMYPFLPTDKCIDKHEDHYMKEIFERCKAW